MDDKTVLLTGGCGFIGSHLAEAYLNNKYKVVVVDNFSSGKIENLDGVKSNENLTVREADIRDRDSVFAIMKEFRPSLVNHHAAQKSIPYSVEDPVYDVTENLIGLLNLIAAAKEYGVKDFVFASSGGALSKDLEENEKSEEKDLPQLESPYAVTKYAGENYLRIYSKLNGFNYTVLRYGNVYGPRQIKEGECGVIPIFVDNTLNGKSSVLMTYDDMPDGCARDYVYVGDVVNANMLASANPLNDVVNIASGVAAYTLDVYKSIQSVFGASVPISVKGPRLGDLRRSVLNAGKAGKLLGWEPKVSLTEGLKSIKAGNRLV